MNDINDNANPRKADFRKSVTLLKAGNSSLFCRGCNATFHCTHTLTIPGHSDRETFFEATVLTSVAVESKHQTFPVAETTIFALPLNAAPEKALKTRIE